MTSKLNESGINDNISKLANTLTSKKVLLKGISWNVLGKVLPMSVAFFSMPLIIKGLGIEKFGILTLIWSVIGYANFFDLGMGRALTQLVSKKLGENDLSGLSRIVWTGIIVLFGFGLTGSLAMFLSADYIAEHLLKISPVYLDEAVSSIKLMALCLPIFFVTSGLAGVLSSFQKFGIINLINVPLALCNYLAPLLVIVITKRLDIVVFTLVMGRFISAVMHFWATSKQVKDFFKISFDIESLKKMLKFGGWVTVSSIISPLMVSLDRFFIANTLSSSVVAFYTTPFEVVTRFLFIPGAVVSVLFPAFASELNNNNARVKLIFFKATKYIFLILFIPAILIIFGAKIGLSLWISPEFAEKSYRAAQFLAVGIVFNGMAFIPYALIQAKGRSDITAKFHMVEFPVYAVCLILFIKSFGITGAAIAWMARVIADYVLLMVYALNIISYNSETVLEKVNG